MYACSQMHQMFHSLCCYLQVQWEVHAIMTVGVVKVTGLRATNDDWRGFHCRSRLLYMLQNITPADLAREEVVVPYHPAV